MAYVTLNRTQDDYFHGSICDVVYQKKQFSWTAKKPKIKEQKAWERSKLIAIIATILYDAGKDNTNGALYFDGKKRKNSVRIGKHTFYQ